MINFNLNKEEQLREATILKNWALAQGYETCINVSDKTFGCSTYVYITIDGVYNWKIRFSDHGVSNLNRMWEESHAMDAKAEIEIIKIELEERRAAVAKSIKGAKEEEALLSKLESKFTIPEGYEVFICKRTYQDKETFLSSKPNAQGVYQKELDKGAFYYEYLDKKNGYGQDHFSKDYLKNK